MKGFYEAALRAEKDGKEFCFLTLDGKAYEVCGGYKELDVNENGISLGILDTTYESEYEFISSNNYEEYFRIPEFKKTIISKPVEENKTFVYGGEEFKVLAYGCPVDGIELPEETLNRDIDAFLRDVLSPKYEEYDVELVKELGEVFRNICNRNGYVVVDTIGKAHDYDYEMLELALEFFEEVGAQGFVDKF